MFLFRLFVLSAAMVFGSAAQASPSTSFEAPTSMLAGLIVQAGFKCDLVNGKLVCGQTKKGGEKSDVKDDDDDDDDDKPKNKQGVDAELTECTIQQPEGGGGCKTGFKRVCEKMKSGKKCCGCVPDPNAKPVETQQPAVEKVCCTSSHPNGGSATYCGVLADARQSAGNARFNGEPPASISCIPE